MLDLPTQRCTLLNVNTQQDWGSIFEDEERATACQLEVCHLSFARYRIRLKRCCQWVFPLWSIIYGNVTFVGFKKKFCWLFFNLAWIFFMTGESYRRRFMSLLPVVSLAVRRDVNRALLLPFVCRQPRRIWDGDLCADEKACHITLTSHCWAMASSRCFARWFNLSRL